MIDTYLNVIISASLRNAIFIAITTTWFCFFYQSKSTKIALLGSYTY
jgi:hypothetical protein